MNNKGFTLIEVLVTLVIFSLITLIVSNLINTTLAISKEDSYNLLKNNVIKASYNYLNECSADLIECEYNNENYIFESNELIQNGYIKNLKSPIDNKNLSECLKIKVTHDNGVRIVDLIDDCY